MKTAIFVSGLHSVVNSRFAGGTPLCDKFDVWALRPYRFDGFTGRVKSVCETATPDVRVRVERGPRDMPACSCRSEESGSGGYDGEPIRGWPVLRGFVLAHLLYSHPKK